MRVLILDPAGNGLDLALRMQADGHQVKLFIRQTDKTKAIGRGLVDIPDEYQKWLRWSDLLVLTDNTFYMRDVDAHRKEGGLVIGATQKSAAWELDREAGQKILRKAGIQVPAYKTFTDYDKAIAYVKKEDSRFVSKPSGDADKKLSYVAQSPADLVYMLERWKKLGSLKGEFILQDFVPGCEMAVGAFFGPAGFQGPWCENFEFKKLMNGDMGCATGEQGTILRFVRKSKLASIVLEPLAEALAQAGHTGYIDVNCIIDDEGQPWPLEFTTRFGWPTMNIQQALHNGDRAEWLLELAKGNPEQNWTLDQVAIGVVLSIPDYPYSHLTRKEVVGVPVYGLKPDLLPHVHPCEMKMGEAPMEIRGGIATAPCWVTAGDYVLVMSAAADSVQDARETVYRRLNRLTVPNSPQWRTDIGRRLASQLPKIQTHGYATGMSYPSTQRS